MTATPHFDARYNKFRTDDQDSSGSTLARLVASSMGRCIREIVITLAVVFPVVFIAASYLEDLVETGGHEGTLELSALIIGLPSRLISVASNAGYLGVFFLMLLDSAGFPLPSEIVLPLAGYLVFRGVLQYWPIVFYSTVAALLGSSVDYYIGRKLGSHVNTGQDGLPYISAAHLQRVQAWFDVHGHAAIALLRLVPVARVLISFPAGACRMNPVTFELYTLLGCLTWNMILVYVGWRLGSSWGVATSLFQYLSPLVYFCMIVFAFWTISRRRNFWPNA